MRNANRNSQFDDFTVARIALIQAKAEAYESLSRKSSNKFMDTLRDIFRKPQNKQTADIDANNKPQP